MISRGTLCLYLFIDPTVKSYGNWSETLATLTKVWERGMEHVPSQTLPWGWLPLPGRWKESEAWAIKWQSITFKLVGFLVRWASWNVGRCSHLAGEGSGLGIHAEPGAALANTGPAALLSPRFHPPLWVMLASLPIILCFFGNWTWQHQGRKKTRKRRGGKSGRGLSCKMVLSQLPLKDPNVVSEE